MGLSILIFPTRVKMFTGSTSLSPALRKTAFLSKHFKTTTKRTHQQPTLDHSRHMTSVNKSDSEWRAILSPEQVTLAIHLLVILSWLNPFLQFRILRKKGTEQPGTGEYNKHHEEGVYSCVGCGTSLYKSTTKFDVSFLYCDPYDIC